MANIIVNSNLDNTIADDGFTTLREAVAEANLDALADTITFDASLAGNSFLLSGQLEIRNDVSIDGDTNGDNKADITIDGGGQRILKIVQSNFLGETNDVDLKSLNLTNGVANQAGGGDDGGAIYVGNNVGSLDILDTTIQNSSATFGGGALHVQSGVVTIVNSLLAGNSAGGYGGAIRGFGGDINIINSTISGNSTTGNGGGIIMQGGTLTMSNSTVTLNRADTDGATNSYTTSYGGGLFIGEFATATLNNSVISGNTSGSANVESSVSGLVTQNSSFFGANAQLGALQDNGGTVLTHAPLLGSLLINGGNNAVLPADTLDVDGDGFTVETLPLDGRGQARNADGFVDIGAVESPDYMVTTAADVVDANDGQLSLREALNAANGNTDSNNIFFAASLDNQTITLTQGDLDITQGTVTIHGDIEGDGQLDIELNGGGLGSSGFFNITGASTTVVIDSLNMSGAIVIPLPGIGNGDAAYAIRNAGTLTLSNSQIANTIVIGAPGDLAGQDDGSFSGGNAAIISSSGTLNIVDTLIRDSSATAGNGSLGANGVAFGAGFYNGDTGGAGGHGAVIISSGILNLQNSLFNNVTVTGGTGGQGGNGVSYVGLETYNGRGGNGGTGGDADLIRNAGTVGGEFGLTFSGFTFGNGGYGGNGINGSANGNPGLVGENSIGIRNIGGGTSAGVDNHLSQSLIVHSINVENFPGTVGADVMWGMNSNDVINGFNGNDDIAGGAGDDTLNGGDNDDVVEGGAGNDIMNGDANGAAGDTITFAGFMAAPGTTQGINVDLNISSQQDTGVGLDTITGFENVIGSDFNDNIVSDSGINIIRGGLGNDTLFIDSSFADVAGEVFDGGAGDDTLAFGGSGGSFTINLRNDTLSSIQAFRLTDPGFGNSTTIQLNANQFSLTGIALNAVMNLDGYGDTSETFDIAMGGQSTLSLATLTFTGITDTARFIVTGDGDGETITGSSISDTLLGNGGVDILRGGVGADSLDGGTGADQMEGGTENDSYFVDAALDVVIEAVGGGGGDVVSTTVDYTLAANQEIEQLIANNASGTGTINLTGNNLANAIFGNNGINTINGGGGADQMLGFAGSDLYIVDNALDTVSETANGGTADRVNTSVTYTLAANQQIELFSTTNSTLTGAINLTGNNLANTILGNNGVNNLNGGGGIDRMTGLNGSDNYFVDNALDTVFESANGGTADRVLTAVDYTLAVDQQIEILSTINVAAVNAINLTGNNLANSIAGNNGVNIINGGGGIDSMNGQLGSDLYYVDNALDVVLEGVNAGTADRVLTSVDYTLGFNQQVELFSTANSTLTTAIKLTGNNLANTILGNNGANVINGGLGIDRMTGLNGDDSYTVDNIADVVIEAAGGGTADRVNASVTFTLGLDQQIELFSTTNSAGTGALDLTGNNLANRILGNNGVNVINGGLANDFLTGGLGADRFVFNTALLSNVDTISDFAHLTDDIQLAQSIFTAIGATLNANEFKLGTSAATATERIIYDSATGNLFFDANGVGGTAQVQFAKVTAGTVLDVNDFIMV